MNKSYRIFCLSNKIEKSILYQKWKKENRYSTYIVCIFLGKWLPEPHLNFLGLIYNKNERINLL